MKVSVLASGSKANSCYIETKEAKILVDIGLNCINTEKKLQEIKVDPDEIDGIFITHVHKDHATGLRVFNKKHKAKAYLTESMYKELNEELINYELINEITKIKDITITAIKTSHDAEDSNGYIIENNNESIVYITDTGYINIKNHKLLKNKTMYIMESNHDVEMLLNNPNYPYHLKQRILGDKGHLSNKDSAYYLKKFIGNNTKYIILAHLSEHNNTEELAKKTLINAIEPTNINIKIARQEEVMELMEV